MTPATKPGGARKRASQPLLDTDEARRVALRCLELGLATEPFFSSPERYEAERLVGLLREMV